MNNMEIRTELLKVGMKQYELAELLGIADSALSRKLRKELPDEEKQRILEIIRGKEEGTNGRTL